MEDRVAEPHADDRDRREHTHEHHEEADQEPSPTG
jgi:hypothetical protein